MPRISQCCFVRANENKWLEAVWWDCPKCGKDCKTYDEASYKAGQQAGRQEVVDWIKMTRVFREGYEESELGFLTCKWEAKLKEWGIL